MLLSRGNRDGALQEPRRALAGLIRIFTRIMEHHEKNNTRHRPGGRIVGRLAA
jgi:hypothetical protein